MTTTISQTIWRTSTYRSTITSPITNTKRITATINPTITRTIDRRSTTTVYVPTTTRTSPSAKEEVFELTIELSDSLVEKGYTIGPSLRIYGKDGKDFSIYLSSASSIEASSIYPEFLKDDISWTDLGYPSITVKVLKTKMHVELWIKAYLFGGPDEKSIKFDMDLSGFPYDKGEVIIDEKRDGSLYVVSAPKLTMASHLKVEAQISEDAFNWFKNLIKQPRVYYIKVSLKNEGKDVIVVPTSIFLEPSSLMDVKGDLFTPAVKVTKAPDVGGDLMKAYREIGKVATGGGVSGLANNIVEVMATWTISGAESAKMALSYIIANKLIGKMMVKEEPYIWAPIVKTDEGLWTFSPLEPGKTLEFEFRVVERNYGSLKGEEARIYVFYLEVERLIEIEGAPFIAIFANLLISESGLTDRSVGECYASVNFP
jgi:hypothetical protein